MSDEQVYTFIDGLVDYVIKHYHQDQQNDEDLYNRIRDNFLRMWRTDNV